MNATWKTHRTIKLKAHFIIALLALVAISPAATTAQQTPANRGRAQDHPNSTASMDLNPPSDGAYSKEPYVFEEIERKVRFEADGTGQRDVAWRVRVQSESAVREFGLITYPFASSFESLEVLFVHVRKPDGTVIETPPSDIQELDTAISRQAPMYTDEREKHIAVKSLAVGDVLEAHLRWIIHEPMARGHFWYDHSYYHFGICLRETLQVDVPAKVDVKFRTSGPEPLIREEDGRRLYDFESSNLKKFEESKLPEKNFHGAPPPDIQISSFLSWEEVGNWFGSLEQPKVKVTPEIQTKAKELIEGKSSEDEKLRAIYDFVSTRFRYIGIDLGHGRYTPHAASEVLVNRYGDCKDKHTLFAALLQAAGITAYPVLISSQHRVDPSFPTMSLFNHVITAVSRGDSFLFLDTTPEVAPYGVLMQNLRDRKVLVIPGSAPSLLVSTPSDLPFPSVERVRVDSSIDSQGTLDAKIHLEERGDGEIVLRLVYHSTRQNRWQELTQKLATGMSLVGSVSEVSVAQPDDTRKPFWLDFSYHRTDYPDWKEHRVILPAPRFFITALNEEQKLSKDPLPLGAPNDITYDVTMKFPQGFKPIVPKNVEQDTEFAEFTANYSLENDALRGIFHLKSVAREIPGAKRSEFNSLATSIDETSRRYIGVSGSPASGVQVVASPSPAKTTAAGSSPAQSLYEAAKRAEKDGKYETSAQLYEQVVALDPNHMEAWNALGYDYGKLGQQQKEEAALRKALALDPAARWAHYNLGNVLMAQKKYDEAISEYQKEIETKSNNSLVHLNLGRVYVLSGQPEKAIPELQTAATLMPTSAAVQFNLGLAYAKTGRPEKAAEAFNRSVELEPTAERKNSVAYQMALDNLQLDQAEKYATSATEYAVGKTKDISLDHVSSGDMRLAALVGEYWDTLGWVKFQQGKFSDAEKYVRSAWQVRSIGEIGDHLGQIYERQGRKAEAIEMYSLAVAAPNAMPETRQRLIALVGGEADTNRLIEQAQGKLAKNRTLEVKNAHSADGIAEFWILVVPGPKVIAVKFISGDEALHPFSTEIEATSFPKSFPDDSEIRLLRRGKLSCSRSSDNCNLLLESAETVRLAN
jgi:tetratricopeptide (TPR) repeat protein